MRALLVYPKFPKTFWSFEKVLELVGKKVLVPPLGLITVAALLPEDWEVKLVDRNVRPVTEDEWGWAEVVLVSAMLVQKPDFRAVVAEAKRRGKPVIVGGPYPTSVPQDAEKAGADCLVLDEGELTIPPFLDHVAQNGLPRRSPGEPALTFRSCEKPDVSLSPIPRFDLLDFDAYDTMAVQYSRGCPFLCEFCDIITLYGRRPRTKTSPQLLAELDRLFELGWRKDIFLVDDNFIGNKRNVKALLPELAAWQKRHGYPFNFCTEASIDLAADPELLDLMTRCRFDSVFIGIETPDQDSLKLTRKHQNTRSPLEEAVDKVTRAGIRVMAGFIIGFDNEKPGAGQRIADFIDATGVPTVLFSLLQALPNTGLWNRLKAEGRLLGDAADLNQTSLLNFVPTRPVEEIAREYVAAYERVYNPVSYLERVTRYFLKMGPPKVTPLAPRMRTWREFGKFLRMQLFMVRAMAKVCWQQGVVRETRAIFWARLLQVLSRNPQVFGHYVAVCAHYEHHHEFRQIVRDQITAQLAAYLKEHGGASLEAA